MDKSDQDVEAVDRSVRLEPHLVIDARKYAFDRASMAVEVSKVEDAVEKAKIIYAFLMEGLGR